MINSEEKSLEFLAFGIVYKNLRLAKGFSLDEAAASVSTGANVSRFESGRSMLHADTFFALLENINIRMDEFQYEYNKYLHEKDPLLYSSNISVAYMTHNIVKLRILLKQINELLEKQKDSKKYRLDKVRVEAVISIIDHDFVVPEEDTEFLTNYLLNLKIWGHYDILLLGHTASLFDMATLPKLANQMIEPAQPIIKLPAAERALIGTLLNIIELFIRNHQDTNAEKFISYLEESNIHDYYAGEKLTLIYHKAHLAFQNGDKSGLDTMKQCQKTLEFCKSFGLANELNQEISEIEKAMK